MWQSGVLGAIPETGHLHTLGSRDHTHASLATASGVILSSFHALSGPVLSPVKCRLCPEVVGLTDTPPVKGSTWLLRANACVTLSFRAQCGEGAARSPEVSSSFARFPRVLWPGGAVHTSPVPKGKLKKKKSH